MNLGYVTTTDFADCLVWELGIPFHKTHHMGECVLALVKKQYRLQDLSLDELSMRRFLML